MRTELETMDSITNYVMNRMSAQERTAFENELRTDLKLREQLEQQLILMEGIKRSGLKTEIGKAGQAYKVRSTTKYIAITIAALAVIGVAMWMLKNQELATGNHETAGAMETTENTLTSNSPANYLPLQVFTINNATDTIIETAEGIVFAIPAGTYGVNGNVDVEIREALHATDIIMSGLSTTSNGEILETAGMFHIRATQNGKELIMQKTITAQVPAEEIKPGMQLFDGVQNADGSVNWINPKPQENILNTVDVTTLDFYPPGYLKKVADLGYDATDKRFTDSLYYSFSGRMDKSLGLIEPVETAEDISDEEYQLRFSNGGNSASMLTQGIALDPARIKAIWNSQFNNTILATKEFEERLQSIHEFCDGAETSDNSLLSFYINNLEKNLYEIDSLVVVSHIGEDVRAGQIYARFKDFCNRRDGKVKTDDAQVNALRKYYAEKVNIYQSALAKTQREFDMKEEQELQDLQKSMNKKSSERRQQLEAMRSEQFMKEYEINMDEAYRQLGKPRPPKSNPPKNNYLVRLSTSGLKNIDAYVAESLVKRMTLDYTDPETGKKAVIKYDSLNVKIVNESNYDRVNIYLIPKKLNSYLLMYKPLDKYIYKLNELLDYKLVCLAHKGEQVFIYQQESVSPGDFAVSLVMEPMKEVEDILSGCDKNLGSFSMQKELELIKSQINFDKKLRTAQKENQITNELWPVVFPCLVRVSLH